MKPDRFYKSAEWQTARLQCLHDSGWLCARCNTSLVGLGRKAHVHHRKPFKHAPSLRSEPLNLMPLCVSCHDAEHHRMKGKVSAACDVNGRPIDASHPWYPK